MNITNIVDVVILLMFLLMGLVGFKKGVIKQGVTTIGTILIFVLAFYLKNPIAEFLSLHLPFLSFGGLFKGVTALNIIMYQLISFIIVMAVLQIALNVLIKVSGIIEKVLKFTIILGIPSKILGLILGLVEGYIIIFIVLFFLKQPAFNLTIFHDSELTPKILNSTPVLSNLAGGMVDTVNDLYSLGEKYKDAKDSNQFNKEAIDTMLEHKIVSVDYIEKLIDKGKIDIIGIDSILNKYR